MKIAIVDDEEYWCKKAGNIIRKFYDNDIEIDNYNSGIDYLSSNKIYDIVFVDIEMPLMDGFDIINKSRENNPDGIYIIMTTHSEMGRKGYLVNAFRYIDKQKIEDEITEALTSANILFEMNKMITINVIGIGTVNIQLKNIFYLETEKHCVLVHTQNDVLRCSDSMTDMEKQLETKSFCRCHNAYIVNLNMVKILDKSFAILANGDKVEISRRKHLDFQNRYLEWKFYCANA